MVPHNSWSAGHAGKDVFGGDQPCGIRMLEKGKGCDIGYALATNSCEEPTAWRHAPSQPLMRSPLSRSQTPTTPRRAVGFFRSGCPLGYPSELITQPTSDWQKFN